LSKLTLLFSSHKVQACKLTNTY